MKRALLIMLLLLIAAPAFAMTPDEIQEDYTKSYNYEKLEDYKTAIDALHEVYAEYEDGYTVNLRLGWLYYLNGSYANSIHHYKSAMKIASSSIEAKLGCMLPLMAQEKYEEVESLAYQILKADGNNYYASLRLAYALRKQEKYELAEKTANEMLVLYPTDVSFLTELALLKSQQKEYKEAGNYFWNILVLDPENVTAKSFFED